MLVELVSLRLDGDRSADPADYSKRGVVGNLLVGFVNGKISAKALGQRRGLTFPLSEGVVLAEYPTRATLAAWSKVHWLTIDSRGVRAVAPPKRRRRPPRDRLESILDRRLG